MYTTLISIISSWKKYLSLECFDTLAVTCNVCKLKHKKIGFNLPELGISPTPKNNLLILTVNRVFQNLRLCHRKRSAFSVLSLLLWWFLNKDFLQCYLYFYRTQFLICFRVFRHFKNRFSKANIWSRWSFLC